MSFSPFSSAWFGAGRQSLEDRVSIAGRLEGDHVLVPLVNPEVPAITDQLAVARTLARMHDASLEVVNPITLPGPTPSEARAEVADGDDRELLNWALAEAETATGRVQGTFLYGRRLVEGMLEAVRAKDADTLVLPRDTSKPMFRRGVTERLAARADCDVVVVNGEPQYESVGSILLPVAGGPHSGLATDVARSVAAAHDAWVDVLHVVEPGASDARQDAGEEYLESAYDRLDRPESTSRWLLEAEGDVGEAIVEQSEYYDVTVVGAPTAGRLRRLVYGSRNRTVRAGAESLVLSARSHDREESLMREWYWSPLEE
jgi:nucleotide-binding universal stress UspA family protein